MKYETRWLTTRLPVFVRVLLFRYQFTPIRVCENGCAFELLNMRGTNKKPTCYKSTWGMSSLLLSVYGYHGKACY